MKRLMIAAVLLAGVAVAAVAQDMNRFFDNARVRKQLNLTDQEVQALQKAWDDAHQKIQLANADKGVKAAELKRLLLATPVDMNAVQKTLRDAMDVEYAIRLAQIELAIQIKGILGDKRWADAQRYLRGLRARMRNFDRDGRGPNRRNNPRNANPPRNPPPNGN
jgi:hypothetical protein